MPFSPGAGILPMKVKRQVFRMNTYELNRRQALLTAGMGALSLGMPGMVMGRDKLDESGKRVPMEVKVGDKVIYSKFAGTEYKDGDEEYLILRESDILAKIS